MKRKKKRKRRGRHGRLKPRGGGHFEWREYIVIVIQDRHVSLTSFCLYVQVIDENFKDIGPLDSLIT